MVTLAVPLAALLAIGPVFYTSMLRARHAADLVDRSLKVRDQIENVGDLYTDASTHVRTYLSSGSEQDVESYQRDVEGLPVALGHLQDLVQDDPPQEALASQIGPAGLDLLGILAQLRSSPRAGLSRSPMDVKLVLRSVDAMNSVRAELETMRSQQDELLLQRTVDADRESRITAIVAIATIPVALLIGLVSTLLFTSSVVRRVRVKTDNARRLAEGIPLIPMGPRRDEIGLLGDALRDAEALLADRQKALAKSEAQYRALAHNFPNGAIVLFDHDLRFTLAEGQVLEAVGLSKEGVEGKTVWEVLPPETAPAAAEQYRAALRGKSSTMERPFGDRIFLIQVVPVESDTGEIVAGMLVSIDITARKQAEEDTRATQADYQYRTLVEQLPVVVYRAKFGEGGAWSYVSPQVESLMGYPQEDWIADPRFWYEHILPEDRESVLRAEVHSRETGQPFASEYRMVARDGRILWLRDEAHVLSEEDGTRSFIQGVMVDITESKLAKQAIERLNDELEQRVVERTADLETANVGLREAKEVAERANSAKSEFLSRMSHELRTPLNAILGFGQLIETSALAPDDLESVEQILKGGRHLLELINEVLDISKIESSRPSLSIEPVSVNEIVHEAIDLISPLCAERGIELAATLSQPSPFVLADRQRLKQVLLNLLSNAIKYNRMQGRIDVSCGALGNDRLAMRVTDTGPGIPLEDLDRLFTPFDRLGAERTGAEGTGLGLALSKAVIESMGGRIIVESEQGRGSTFTVELPASREPGWDVDGSEQVQVVEPSGSSRLQTVLYIEDNLANVALVERILLQRPSVKLIAAMQGRLGFELAREHSPALVLLDLHLPDLSGEEALERLRQDPLTRHIPVIVMSADSTPGQVDRLRAMGIDDYVTKPLDVTRFLGVVDRALAASDRTAGASSIGA